MENFSLRLELCKMIFKEILNFHNKYLNLMKEFRETIKNNIISYIKITGVELSKGYISSYLIYINHIFEKKIKNFDDNINSIEENIEKIQKNIKNQNISVIKELGDEKENIIKCLDKINKIKTNYYERIEITENSLIAYEEINNKNQTDDKLFNIVKENIKKTKETEKEYSDNIENITLLRDNYYKKLNNFILNYREFNSFEVQILYNLFSTIDKIQENEKVITNTAKNYYFNNLQIAYEQLDVPLINNDNINKDYEIIPYVPLSYSYIFSSSNNDKKVYFNVIKKLSQEFYLISEEIFDNNSLGKFTTFSNIINHIIYYCQTFSKEELDSLRVYFKEKRYRDKFLLFLNQKRANSNLFQDPISFKNICDVFKILFENIDIGNTKDHGNIKYAILLSNSFYTLINNKKIFIANLIDLNSVINQNILPWINFIEKEIEENNMIGMEFFIVISFSANLKDILKNKEKILSVFNYFIEKYKFNETQINDLHEQIKDLKEEKSSENKKIEEQKEN